MRIAPTLMGALLVTGCVSAPAPSPGPAPVRPAVRPSPIKPSPGLEGVIGRQRGDIVRLFGEPAAETVEVAGRKLQFRGSACILDAYLYPDGRNGAEIVAHVDTRRSDGAAVDRVACVAALSRR